MKTLIVLLACFSVISGARAQGLQEWFNQNNTQRGYMLAQIAALQTYLDYSKKGYNLVRDGLHTVSAIKSGDYDLHKIFIDKYALVNPVVKKYSRVADILRLQQQITSACKAGRQLAASTGFIGNESSYLLRVFNNALNIAANNLGDLNSIVVSGTVKMTDAERIIQIDKIYKRQAELYDFVRSFEKDTQLLLIAKRQTAGNMQAIKDWYKH